MAGHIVLLGDSIFDNASYVPAGHSVIEQLLSALPADWDATLVAVDGATVASVFDQVGRMPAAATHLILSVGGNDALWASGDTLNAKARDVRHALELVGETCAKFTYSYVRLVSALQAVQLPLMLCTIYDAIPGLGSAEVAGLCLFNDAISRTAFERRLTLIDLRLICNQASDYSRISPIEPSVSGGTKIVHAILRATIETEASSRVVA